jgi:HTH-type transcriptional regulator / antitoxin HigA
MITNDFQYRNTKALLAEFEAKIDALEATALTASRPKLRTIEIAAVRSQAESFREEIMAYEKLRSGDVDTFTAVGLPGIAELFIKARVARGWTQATLAEALGIAVQQVQRYESTSYRSASLARLTDVAAALGVEMSEVAILRRTA